MLPTETTRGTAHAPEWLDSAKCATLPPHAADNIFHPTNEDYSLAIAYCQNCPVKRQCASLGAKSKYGVYGGLTPDQRKESAKQPPL